jgi:hypothetical protein
MSPCRVDTAKLPATAIWSVAAALIGFVAVRLPEAAKLPSETAALAMMLFEMVTGLTLAVADAAGKVRCTVGTTVPPAKVPTADGRVMIADVPVTVVCAVAVTIADGSAIIGTIAGGPTDAARAAGPAIVPVTVRPTVPATVETLADGNTMVALESVLTAGTRADDATDADGTVRLTVWVTAPTIADTVADGRATIAAGVSAPTAAVAAAWPSVMPTVGAIVPVNVVALIAGTATMLVAAGVIEPMIAETVADGRANVSAELGASVCAMAVTAADGREIVAVSAVEMDGP